MRKLLQFLLAFLLVGQFSCSPSSKQETPLRVRLPQDPESLHPLSYGNAHALQLINLLYQSLLTVDPTTRELKPLLAAGLPEVKIKDTLSYFTYQIRPQAKWDNGQPVTAQDVAFSLKLLNSPLLDNERWRAQYHFIKDIAISPEKPLQFTIVCSGFTPEMQLLTGDFFVLPAYKLDPKGVLSNIPFSIVKGKYDSLASSPSLKALAEEINHPKLARDTAWVRGSGPYKLVSWQNGQQLTLIKKTAWWGEALAKDNPTLVVRPETVQFQIVPDNAAAILALRAKQLDVMDNIPLPSFQEMQKDEELKKQFSLYTAPTFDVVFLGMNGANPLLKDKTTRQAIANLINTQQLIKNVHGGLATPTVGLVHPNEKQNYNEALTPAAFDLTKAQELLKRGGWHKTNTGWEKGQDPDRKQLALNVLYRGGNSEFETVALLFQQNAKAAGIPVTLQAVESSQISERLAKGDYDLYIRTFVGNPFSYNLIPILHTSSIGDGGGNVTSFGTAETDQLLEKIAKEQSATRKAGLLKQLQKEMQQESNLVFLYFQQNKMAVSKRVDSVKVSSLSPGYDLPKFVVKQ